MVGALVVLTKDVVGGLDGVAVRGLVGVGGDEAYLFTGKVGTPKKMPANNSGKGQHRAWQPCAGPRRAQRHSSGRSDLPGAEPG